MPLARPHRLVVLGSTRVGKTALIEQLIFGNHVVGLVSEWECMYMYSAYTDTTVRADQRRWVTCMRYYWKPTVMAWSRFRSTTRQEMSVSVCGYTHTVVLHISLHCSCSMWRV